MAEFVPFSSGGGGGGGLEDNLSSDLLKPLGVDPFIIADRNAFAGKIFRNIIGIPFETFKKLETLSDIAKNKQAMTVISSDELTMRTVVSSRYVMDILADNSIAVGELSTSKIAMEIILSNEVAKIALSSNAIATETIVNKNSDKIKTYTESQSYSSWSSKVIVERPVFLVSGVQNDNWSSISLGKSMVTGEDIRLGATVRNINQFVNRIHASFGGSSSSNVRLTIKYIDFS